MCIRGHTEYHVYTDAHRPFVFGTFQESLTETPSITSDTRRLYEHALKRAMMDPSTRAVVLVPRGAPDEFLGWAVASDTALLYVYVRFPYRRGKLGEHLGTSLIERVTLDREMPLAIWTMDASRMAASGFPFRYDLDENERFRQLAR